MSGNTTPSKPAQIRPTPSTPKSKVSKRNWFARLLPHLRFAALVLQLAVSIAIVGAAFYFGPGLAGNWQSIAVGCIAVPFSLILLVHSTYLLARAVHWQYRLRLEKAAKAGMRASKPQRKVETFDEIHLIDTAQHKELKGVPDAQGKYRARALTTYFAPPLAVLLVCLEQIVWPDTTFGSGLVLGEGSLIGFVLIRLVLDSRPTKKWIILRTRSEILRREQYVALAKAGPYLPTSQRRQAVADRIGAICTSGEDRLLSLLPQQHENGVLWSDDLFRSASTTALFDDLLDRLSCYSHRRLDGQIAWMRSAQSEMKGSAKELAFLLLFVALATMVVAVIHFFQIGNAIAAAAIAASGSPSQVPAAPTQGFADGVRVLGVFLPALSGAVLALQAVFNMRFLAANYKDTEVQLDRLRLPFTDLEREVRGLPETATAVEQRELEVRFQTLLLRAEGVLTEELTRWRMVTQRDAH